MGTPKTRIPKELRNDVRLAIQCWRDYLIAIDNTAGADAARDLAMVLGLEPIPDYVPPGRYSHSALRGLLKNIKQYGAR